MVLRPETVDSRRELKNILGMTSKQITKQEIYVQQNILHKTQFSGAEEVP